MRALVAIHGLVGGLGALVVSLGVVINHQGGLVAQYPSAAGFIRGSAIAVALFGVLGAVAGLMAAEGRREGGLMVFAGIGVLAGGFLLSYSMWVFSTLILAGGVIAANASKESWNSPLSGIVTRPAPGPADSDDDKPKAKS